MDEQATASSQDNQSTTTPAPAPAPSSASVPASADEVEETTEEITEETSADDVVADVVAKIGEAHNILIALSSDPSVDELSAAIGLSFYLDRLGKHATAIYSGATPNALEFLNPEETFESTADSLQDFVIALNKEKADHLRYKLDGDFVKIFITPYKVRITEEDLEYSYGDYNVDLVLALDVANGIDLDSALREHGRIMHDAVIINITTGKPGKFGEIEWSDKKASSVSEMIATLLYNINSKVKIEKEEATAFLTGIVAATNRFSSASTTAATMELSSRLMESGANQQLISKNITPDIENEMFAKFNLTSTKKDSGDSTKLEIQHDEDKADTHEDAEVDTIVTEKESTLLDDLKAAEASLAQAGAETTPEATNAPIKIDSAESASPASVDEPAAPAATDASTAEPVAEPVAESSTEPTPVESSPEPTSSAEPYSAAEPVASTDYLVSEDSPVIDYSKFVSDKPEKVLQPSSDIFTASEENPSKYGQMLEDALAGVSSSSEQPAASSNEPLPTEASAALPNTNPATASAPVVPASPEINGVPSINYMPMPGEEILPPPPTPPIMPEAEPAAPIESVAPVAPVATGAASPEAPTTSVDPSAFQIPGM